LIWQGTNNGPLYGRCQEDAPRPLFPSYNNYGKGVKPAFDS